MMIFNTLMMLNKTYSIENLSELYSMLIDETIAKTHLLKYIYENDKYFDMILWLELQRVAEHEDNRVLTSCIIDTNSSTLDITEILIYIKETLNNDEYLLIPEEALDKNKSSKSVIECLTGSLPCDNYRIIFSLFYNKERCFGVNYDKTFYKNKYKHISECMSKDDLNNLLQIIEVVIEYNDFKTNFYWIDSLIHNTNRQIKEQIYHFLYRCR